MFKGCLILIEFGKLGKFASSVGISENSIIIEADLQ